MTFVTAAANVIPNSKWDIRAYWFFLCVVAHMLNPLNQELNLWELADWIATSSQKLIDKWTFQCPLSRAFEKHLFTSHSNNQSWCLKIIFTMFLISINKICRKVKKQFLHNVLLDLILWCSMMIVRFWVAFFPSGTVPLL